MTRAESASTTVSRRSSARGDADCTLVWVRGEHDIATRASLAVTLARAEQLDGVPLLVDLSSVTFMDASTIGVLVASRNRLRSRGLSLQLRAPSPRALQVLELCGLAHLIQQQPAIPTRAPALATWVDIGPIAPAAEADTPDSRVAARAAAPAPAGELVTADATVGEPAAAVEADRGGP
jgi:anti-sigma B factor antagonist